MTNNHTPRLTGLDDDPLWYKDAIIYELHVRAFYDSNADGIGDFRGLTEKLDYLHDLGVTALWLLPFYPSPLRDDGYDIADYTSVHPSYGTLRDFRRFMREATRRGLRVITELVLNHTSDQHPWFQRARRATAGSRWRNFYVWHDSPERYQEARIIFKDFEASNWSWDALAKSYVWHRFYSHQPDLNFTSALVRRAVLHSMDFWLDMGVSGLRLDAVPYLFERDGTSCENLPETHAFLKELRQHLDTKFAHRMLLAEANQWPEDAAAYFGGGEECHMNFHFPLMPRMFMAVRMEDRQPIVDVLQQMPSIPHACQWAMFLRNHDELTLEMVTDEERDYMYRVYAHDAHMRLNLGIRRRLAPLLNNNRRQIELLHGLLLSLPGTPVLYYGDEIGMGDNVYLGDRNGVRTPMQWSADRNAGFSRANPQQLYLPIIIDPEYHYEAINVEAQARNTASLLWWLKRMIAMRKRYKAFGRGEIQFLLPDNPKILAFVRTYQEEMLLVVANLSRLPQYAALDLSAFQGLTPVELSGSTAFPVIRDTPYPMMLGSYAFQWFALESQRVELVSPQPIITADRVPTIVLADTRDDIFHEEHRPALAGALRSYLLQCRWFGGKGRRIQAVTLGEVVPMHTNGTLTSLVFVHVDYLEGEPEVYLAPLVILAGDQAQQRLQASPATVVTRLLSRTKEPRVLCDALAETSWANALLQAMMRHRNFRGAHGDLVTSTTRAFRSLQRPLETPLTARILSTEQSNTSVVYGETFILKFFRRVGEGINPDLEMGRFLTEKTSFQHSPAVAGVLEYRPSHAGQPCTVGLLQAFVLNQGDAWRYTLDAIEHSCERALAEPELDTLSVPTTLPLGLSDQAIPPMIADLIGTYLNSARLLGPRPGLDHHPPGGPPPAGTLDGLLILLGGRGLPRCLFTRRRPACLYTATFRRTAHPAGHLSPRKSSLRGGL
jgi:maltose alpha-D-glucosyltransferase/alpha-amylase